MEIDREHIIELILEEVHELISDEDKAYLYNVVAEDESIFQLYMETHAKLDSEEVKLGMERLSQLHQSRRFSLFLKRESSLWWKYMLAVVIIKTIMIVSLVLYLDRLYLEKHPKAPSAISK